MAKGITPRGSDDFDGMGNWRARSMTWAPTIDLLFSTLQRQGRLTLPVGNLREVIFDREQFGSPLDELRQMAMSAIGSVKIRDNSGFIIIIEWQRGKRTTSDAQMVGQKLSDRRRMLGHSTGSMGQISGLGGEKIIAIEEARADLGTHHGISSRDGSVDQYQDCLRQLEAGIPAQRVRKLWWR
jgi:hypothetical protein